jgi:hypothetical protein
MSTFISGFILGLTVFPAWAWLKPLLIGKAKKKIEKKLS